MFRKPPGSRFAARISSLLWIAQNRNILLSVGSLLTSFANKRFTLSSFDVVSFMLGALLELQDHPTRSLTDCGVVLILSLDRLRLR